LSRLSDTLSARHAHAWGAAALHRCLSGDSGQLVPHYLPAVSAAVQEHAHATAARPSTEPLHHRDGVVAGGNWPPHQHGHPLATRIALWTTTLGVREYLMPRRSKPLQNCFRWVRTITCRRGWDSGHSWWRAPEANWPGSNAFGDVDCQLMVNGNGLEYSREPGFSWGRGARPDGLLRAFGWIVSARIDKADGQTECLYPSRHVPSDHLPPVSRRRCTLGLSVRTSCASLSGS
jgi:hypothetical protein